MKEFNIFKQKQYIKHHCLLVRRRKSWGAARGLRRCAPKRNGMYFYYISVKKQFLQKLRYKMVFTFAKCIEMFGSKYLIKKALAEGHLFRIAKGFYSESEHVLEVSLISAKYPKAVFTMNTAFYHYGLTDSVPEKYYLAAERGAKISDKSVALKFENSDILLLGAVQENLNGTMVTMYNRERMLLELIRNKTSMTFDYYKEFVLSYRRILDNLDMQLVQDYLPQMPKSDMIRKVLEAEVM